MKRRSFIFGTLAALLGGLTAKAARAHTDFDYAHVDTHRECIPLLDGKFVHAVQEANAVDGWVRQRVLTPNGKTGWEDRIIKGMVQILKPTPELSAAFQESSKRWWALRGVTHRAGGQS